MLSEYESREGFPYLCPLKAEFSNIPNCLEEPRGKVAEGTVQSRKKAKERECEEREDERKGAERTALIGKVGVNERMGGNPWFKVRDWVGWCSWQRVV